jgi:phosphoglycolate phosphatase
MNNRRFDLAIFDLDGTLIDSKTDLALSVNATREHLGLTPLAHETIYTYVGNGAPMLIRRALGDGFADEDYARALDFFVRYYHDHRLDHTRLYPGVEESLETLAEAGVALAVLTNKPVKISDAIMDGLGVASLFFRVYGGNSFAEKKPHPIGIQKLMEERRTAPERTLMVGDSTVDIQTAINAGCRSCGVTYGLQPETLADPRPDFLVDHASAWLPIILG